MLINKALIKEVPDIRIYYKLVHKLDLYKPALLIEPSTLKYRLQTK